MQQININIKRVTFAMFEFILPKYDFNKNYTDPTFIFATMTAADLAAASPLSSAIISGATQPSEKTGIYGGKYFSLN